MNFDDVTLEEMEYLWDFGNGETSTEENPTFIYNQSSNGTFTVLLTTDDGTDIVPDPLPDPPPPPLTNTFELQVEVVSVPIIIGDPHSSPSDVMKQYGNTDASTSYNYEMQIARLNSWLVPSTSTLRAVPGQNMPGQNLPCQATASSKRVAQCQVQRCLV